jgi:hypothetical protein
MRRVSYLIVVLALVAGLRKPLRGGGQDNSPKIAFHTSDRCLACHNGLTTPSGKDVSIGFNWRASIMANSSRDPYWQASARRETIDHPESKALIEDECSVCHMPIPRYQAKEQKQLGKIFEFLPFNEKNEDAKDAEKSAPAQDGITCSVCHQIGKAKLGTQDSFNGGFQLDQPGSKTNHPEYGPYAIENGQALIMQSSTGGFRPIFSDQISDSKLCATCHTLYTTARGEGGKAVGQLPEQMPYLEWLRSDYANQQSCQSCHMPEVTEPAPIAAVLGVNRPHVRQHVFVGGNFFMQTMLNKYRGELSVAALPQELTNASAGTVAFLQSQAAQVSIGNLRVDSGKLNAEVAVKNLTGHKLPTAFPSRRAWLHFIVRDREGKTVFESGALKADGSIEGNDNDVDPTRFEPHYRRIERADEVQIYEPILGDSAGHVTTGLLTAVGYLKDNRLLPQGFRKEGAERDIAVIGDAADDPNFRDGIDTVEYAAELGNAQGPFRVEVELFYQPIGFRWAHNLASYDTAETKRVVQYYDSMASTTAVVLSHAEAMR